MLRNAVYCFTCLLLVMALAASPALASKKKPSDKNCRDLGEMLVKCYSCDTMQYKGQVTVQGQYHSGSNTCFGRGTEAQQRCANAYGLKVRNTYVRVDYKLGSKGYWAHYPARCKK